MINLLPHSEKVDIALSRRNAKLLKASMICLFVITANVLIAFAGIFYMNQSIANLRTQKDLATQELATSKYDETVKKVEDISNNLKLTTQVLSREILFSKLIKEIGSVMPSNTSLTDLKIGNTDGAIDLTAIASDYTSASQIVVNLQDSSTKIFDKADLLNTTCSGGTADSRYPCTVRIRARFEKSTSYMFIAPETKK